jgi:uncharacterized membrane protein
MGESLPREQGEFRVHLASREFVVAPGQSLPIPVLLYNQSTEDQNLTLSIRGIPSTWVSVPSPLVYLVPGEQREVVLTVQPPAFPEGRAGRHALAIRVASQQAPALPCLPAALGLMLVPLLVKSKKNG